MGRLLALVAVVILSGPAFADPLKFISKEAGVVVKIESPRELIESAVQLDAWKKLQAFPQMKEILDSKNVQRFLQVLAYIETQTGSKWPELLDQVAGNGVAIGFKPGTDPAPTLAVIDGKDEATVAKVFSIIVAGIKDEAEREGKAKVTEAEFLGVPTLNIGDAFLARSGPRIFLANKKAAIEAGLSLAKEKGASIIESDSLQKAKSLVGPDAAAWLWFDLQTAKNTDEGKNFFENSKKDLFQLMLFGSTVDAAKRSKFLAAGFYLEPTGYRYSVRLPAKRSELDPIMHMHVPPKGLQNSKPLLEPPGVLLSQSFYLDLDFIWKHRSDVMSADQLKEFERGVNEISKLIPGTTIPKILEQLGPYHRIVMAHTGEKLYAKEPGQPIPPTAYIGSMRDPELRKSLDGMLRAGGLIGSFQLKWKMTEATHDGVKIATFRFPETDELDKGDPQRNRFNAAPSFAFTEDSVIIGSTPGIVKTVIPLLKREKTSAGEVWKLKAYAAGAADVVTAHPDATVTDAVLRQGITLAEARRQTVDFAQWLRTLGNATLSIEHGDDYYSFNAAWSYKK